MGPSNFSSLVNSSNNKVASSTRTLPAMELLHYSRTIRATLCRISQQVSSLNLSRCNRSKRASQVNHRRSAMPKLRSNRASRRELPQCRRFLSSSRTRISNHSSPPQLQFNSPKLRGLRRWQIASRQHHLRPRLEDVGRRKQRLVRGSQILGCLSSLRKTRQSLRLCSSLRLGMGKRFREISRGICCYGRSWMVIPCLRYGKMDIQAFTKWGYLLIIIPGHLQILPEPDSCIFPNSHSQCTSAT